MFDQRWSEDKPIEFAIHQIIGAVTNNEFRRLKQLFKDFPQLDLVDILNPSLETLLHIACSNASQNIVELIVEYFQESTQKTTRLEDFINMRNSEGFTSVHLASFAGKQQTVEYLHQKGADLTLANVAGLTAMHTASQGDQVTVMCYLRIAGLSINQKDYNGRTPIHWAAYQSANNAAAFLLAWGAKFEDPDFDNQMTPLHYAVVSGSTLIVRKLLQSGAKRNPKDHEGLTPIDHAITKKLDTIQAILSSRSGLAEACNLRQPFEKPRKKKRLVILFCVLYLSTFFASLFFVIPCRMIKLRNTKISITTNKHIIIHNIFILDSIVFLG